MTAQNENEQAQLHYYIYFNYADLRTEQELQMLEVFAIRNKFRDSPDVQREKLNRLGVSLEDPIVAAVIDGGIEAFEEQVAKRILAEHAEEVFINRCPRCSNILRTPLAQQCFSCGHSWHGQAREDDQPTLF